jgi:hypothetical protein
MSDKTMQYHEMAAFVFLLFLVAKDRDSGALFGDFEEQLNSVPQMPLPYKDFRDIVVKIRDVVIKTSTDPRHEKYVALFNNAHGAIKDLFQAMERDALWDVCKAVDFEKLKSVVLLALADLETRPKLEARLSQREW